MGLDRGARGYRRADFTLGTYLDAHGQPIPYGHRWAFDEGPPQDTYSVTAHPQRFNPLHAVAEGLIEYLAGRYAVSVARTETVDLIPMRGASLTFDRSDAEFAGVRLVVGGFARRWYPMCGCDACDEDVIDSIEDLEDFVFAVVDGEYAQWRRGRTITEVIYSGNSVIWQSSRKVSREESRRARALPGRYPPWPLNPQARKPASTSSASG